MEKKKEEKGKEKKTQRSEKYCRFSENDCERFSRKLSRSLRTRARAPPGMSDVLYFLLKISRVTKVFARSCRDVRRLGTLLR